MGDILIGLLEEAYLKQVVTDTAVNRTFTLTIPDSILAVKGNKMVLEYEKRQSPEFWLEKVQDLFDENDHFRNYTIKIASHENPIATPCAGSISFLKDSETGKSYVAMSQKDSRAPRDPGFRVPRNGFPRSPQDWLTLDHLFSETFEEGIFVRKDKKDIILPRNESYDNIILSVAENLEKHTNLRFSGTIRADMYFEPGNDILNIRKENGISREIGASISWTPETGFNVIKRLILNYPLSELLFIDGETFPDGKPIKRDYCVIDLDHLAGKTFGEPITEKIYRHEENGLINIFDRDEYFYTDKVPRSVLCQTKHMGRPIYPIDWLVESRQFLSNANTLRESNLTKYSAIERKQYEAAHKE
jgi:hypothetical protein